MSDPQPDTQPDAQPDLHTIAVVGGTGPQGKGLAYRFARAGHRVVIGSRTPERATAAAEEIGARLGEGAGEVGGAENADACADADLVLLAVPWDGHDELVEQLAPALAGRIVISCVNPLAFDKRGAHGAVVDAGEGSAAEHAQRIVPDATLVGAFHHVSAVLLWADGEADPPPLDDDVLVIGDVREAKEVVMELARAVVGRPGVDSGKLRLARQLEPLTAVLISINRRYKTHAGLRVTGT